MARPAVSRHAALWRPDFPLPANQERLPVRQPANYCRIAARTIGAEHQRGHIGLREVTSADSTGRAASKPSGPFLFALAPAGMGLTLHTCAMVETSRSAILSCGDPLD